MSLSYWKLLYWTEHQNQVEFYQNSCPLWVGLTNGKQCQADLSLIHPSIHCLSQSLETLVIYGTPIINWWFFVFEFSNLNHRCLDFTWMQFRYGVFWRTFQNYEHDEILIFDPLISEEILKVESSWTPATSVIEFNLQYENSLDYKGRFNFKCNGKTEKLLCNLCS